MSTVAVAAPSAVAADAARVAVEAGGGAVDAAIAAAVAAMVSEPGVVAPGAGAFVTVWPRRDDPIVYDGYMAVPGLGGGHASPVDHVVQMEYGGGITTVVGPATIAVPGAWAAFGAAHDAGGHLPWRDVLGPAVRLAEEGTPLGATSAHYLSYAADPVFGGDEAGRAALFGSGGPLEVGARVWVRHLAESLGRIADRGADEVYRGDLGRRIATDLHGRGSHLGVEDLASYRVEPRSPLMITLGEWTLATNPSPAVGGAALAAILGLSSGKGINALIDAQGRVYRWRRDGADQAEDRGTVVDELLRGLPGDPIRSPSTAHVSAAGPDGVCAVTLSAGYGSGVIPAGTGMWMNNGLGELELVGDPRRLHPGDRLNSNMAPTVGRHTDGRSLAIGSPGADRITSAIAQTLLHLESGLPPSLAVAAPRVHVDVGEGGVTIAHEPGVDVSHRREDVREFDSLHMYFGGVGLAMRDSAGIVTAVTDPRRNGVAFPS
jgi:gamma-glutamyltranspeptidase / glutathione hydrolase